MEGHASHHVKMAGEVTAFETTDELVEADLRRSHGQPLAVRAEGNASQATDPGLEGLEAQAVGLAFQSRAVWSMPIVAISVPSGLNATPVAAAEWPRKALCSAPPGRSHTRTVPSIVAAASARPSGL